MRIAVIGSGISGLTAAYLLAPHGEVTLFEQEKRLGGHANTALLRSNDETIAVDTGFMVFNPGKYPNFVALLTELGVETQDTNMSFSTSIPGEVEYGSSLRGIFGDVSQTLNPRYLRFLMEILRFNKLGKAFLRDSVTPMRMGEFLDQHSFSKELSAWYLYPMMGSIWSSGVSDLRNFPVRETLQFLDNHQLLSIVGGPQWKTIKGGSIQYVEALSKLLIAEGVHIQLGANIQRVVRTSKVEVHADFVQTFDAVVLATHADEALNMLGDASLEEQTVLGAFSYARNTAILHKDTSFRPKRPGARAAWNYLSRNIDEGGEKISVTYDMNLLQHIPRDFPVFVTLNPQRQVPADRIFSSYKYSHPMANDAARKAQQKMPMIQGNRSTYFAGAYWGNGFHEDGVVSAIQAVRAMNLPIRLKP
jgi:uncharacterized protein